MITTDRIFDIATACLTAVEDHYAAEGEDLPDRRYVANGLPAFDCLVADTPVLTVAGPVPIADVTVGTSVWAINADHHLILAPVTHVLERGVQPTFKVRTRNRTIAATASHRVLRLTLPDPSARRTLRNAWVLEWATVAELQRGDHVVVLDHLPDAESVPTFATGRPVTPDSAWLAGLVMADGSVRDDTRSVAVCVYGAQADHVAQVAYSEWRAGSSDAWPSLGRVVFSKQFALDMVGLGLDAHCLRKRVPSEVWDWPTKLQAAFLDGYADGDAHRDPAGLICYASPNRALIDDVRALHQALGDRCDNVHTAQRTKPIVIKGKTVKNALPLHRFRASQNGRKQMSDLLNARSARKALPDTGFTFDTISSITSDSPAPTYDLTVDGAHSFLADAMVVHNCEQVTVFCESTYGIQGDPLAENPSAKFLDAGHAMRSGVFAITIVRCVPTVQSDGADDMTVPSVADETASAREIYADAVLMLNALVAAEVAGDLAGCSNVAFMRWTNENAQGGFGGGTLRAAIALSDL